VTEPIQLIDLSPWFPGDEEHKPVHIGTYRARVTLPNGSRMKTMATWDGMRWRDSLGMALYYQNQEWQGLTVKAATPSESTS
jgi:hypothetical protein